MKIKDIISLIEQTAPLKYSLEMGEVLGWQDNSGLNVGNIDDTVNGVVCSLDATLEVLQFAASQNCNMVIAHHPMIFLVEEGQQMDSCSLERLEFAKRHKINVYASHLSLDVADNGINDALAKALGLTDIEHIMKIPSGLGGGRIGNLQQPMTTTQLANLVKQVLNQPNIRIIAKQNKIHKRVSVIGGSGGDENALNAAIESGADAHITADVKHRQQLYAIKRGLTVIDATHYSTEYLGFSNFCRQLEKKINEVSNTKFIVTDIVYMFLNTEGQ